MQPEAPQIVAGVDLGSNSFHMIVVRVDESGHIHLVDKVRERVRLAAGLTEDQRLTPEAQKRALRTLERMGERVRDLDPGTVRAVGTNTLRQARDPAFLEKAQAALGHPIDIISGREEARLIYLGVSHTLSEDKGRRLVVDIGGGSTECVIGEKFEPVEADSLYMGCVSFTLRFFPDGQITKEAFQRAELAAALELETIASQYKALGWTNAVGSSGTIVATRKVLEANGWSSDHRITLRGLKKLRKALIQFGHIDAVEMLGLEPDRAPVIPGGLAILRAIFDNLGVEEMETAKGALREGLIYDLIGRIRHEDVREKTVAALADLYKVDRDQAKRVRDTALRLFDQAKAPLEIKDEDARQFLEWAAWTHEIGLSISYTGYQKHSAYLLEYVEMPGFSRTGRMVLSAIVLAHRRKLSFDQFDMVRQRHREEVFRLALLFRLAVRMNRSRSKEPLPEIELDAAPGKLQLRFPEGWLDSRPLTRADLADEALALSEVGYDLVWT